MRIFTISDIHIDYAENRRWLYGLSGSDFVDDALILSGDISSRIPEIIKSFVVLRKRFKEVLYIPGNHDLWTDRKSGSRNSIDNFNLIKTIAVNCGVRMEPAHFDSLSVVPLYGWYDYSFGEPSEALSDIWVDYRACEWPEGYDDRSITRFFTSMNESFLDIKNKYIISFSHFVPRIDVMPSYIPADKRVLYPVLGSDLIEKQIRKLSSNMHIYGHTHINNRVILDGTEYINNAYGYPSETIIASKKLLKIYEI